MSSLTGKNNKRDRSPTSLLTLTDSSVQAKKSKGNNGTSPTSNQTIGIEEKMAEIPPTPGNKEFTNQPKATPVNAPETSKHIQPKLTSAETSKHPHPGSFSDETDSVPPLWAHETCSLVKSLMLELREIKNAMVLLEDKLATHNKSELYEIRHAIIDMQQKLRPKENTPPPAYPQTFSDVHLQEPPSHDPLRDAGTNTIDDTEILPLALHHRLLPPTLSTWKAASETGLAWTLNLERKLALLLMTMFK